LALAHPGVVVGVVVGALIAPQKEKTMLEQDTFKVAVRMALAIDAELASRASQRVQTTESPKTSQFTPVIARIRQHAAVSMAQVRPVVYV